jgi:hypothetical protein
MLQTATGGMIKLSDWRGPSAHQSRSRVFQTKKTKAAVNPAAMSIQFWPSKPRKLKCLTKNCTASAPIFGQNNRFRGENILFSYFFVSPATAARELNMGLRLPSSMRHSSPGPPRRKFGGQLDLGRKDAQNDERPGSAGSSDSSLSNSLG